MTRRSFIQFLIAFFAALGYASEIKALVAEIEGAQPQPMLDPQDVFDFAMRDVERIRANLVKALARQSPYMRLLEMESLPISQTTVQVIRSHHV